jgi:hypothetical protein
MIPYEIDPSLHSMHPAQDRLDDGFSPPAVPQDDAAAPDDAVTASTDPCETLLGTKSPF